MPKGDNDDRSARPIDRAFVPFAGDAVDGSGTLLLHLERQDSARQEIDGEPPSLPEEQTLSPAHKDWPHAPVHRLSEPGTFIVTASTLRKEHFFRGEDNLTLLEGKLLALAKQYGLMLEAGAVFSNHYHFVAHTNGTPNQLRNLITQLHYDTAEAINRQNGVPGRQVWFNYWDTQLTFEKSYFARLNYVHQNAVKHGIVRQANKYRWCSAAWLERTATRAQLKTIYGFKIDRVKIDDDYEPVI